MLGHFARTYRDAGPRLQAALAAHDREAAERLAHSCRGAAATVGAVEVAQRAEALEAALREGREGSELAQAADGFAEAVTRLSRALDDALPA